MGRHLPHPPLQQDWESPCNRVCPASPRPAPACSMGESGVPVRSRIARNSVSVRPLLMVFSNSLNRARACPISLGHGISALLRDLRGVSDPCGSRKYSAFPCSWNSPHYFLLTTPLLSILCMWKNFPSPMPCWSRAGTGRLLNMWPSSSLPLVSFWGSGSPRWPPRSLWKRAA